MRAGSDTAAPDPTADTGGATSVSDTGAAHETVGSLGCPEVRLACGAEEVEAQAIVRCTAEVDGAGPVHFDRTRWSLEQPVGSVSVLQEGAQEMTFEANVVGRYAVSVVPDGGGTACAPARFALVAVASSRVHVELLWHTPGDSDESDTGMGLNGDSVGSDMDLHVRHANADAWFDSRWDTDWLNVAPNWAGAGSADDPRLDRNDVDGGGPENFNLDVVEPVTYHIGAHYWDDWGFGPSTATVRVYIDGAFTFEWADVPMIGHDLWEVATIDGTTLAVTPLGDGAPLITQNYPFPLDVGFWF